MQPLDVPVRRYSPEELRYTMYNVHVDYKKYIVTCTSPHMYM